MYIASAAFEIDMPDCLNFKRERFLISFGTNVDSNLVKSSKTFIPPPILILSAFPPSGA